MMKFILTNIQYFLLCIALCLIIPVKTAAEEPRQPVPTTYRFVERDSALFLDVYKPDVPRADKAAVITLFGGGFYLGTRDNWHMKEIAQSLTGRGFTVISIDYRLGLKDSAMVARNRKVSKLTGLFNWCIDIAVEDCAAAVAWVCDNAGMLDIDTSRIILTGNSAGAITVLQLDYYRANSQPGASALPAGWKPAAVVPYAGGIMCHKRDLKYETPPAPTLLMHGTEDKIVKYKSFGLPLSSKIFGARKIDKAMDRQDIPHWFLSYDGKGHEVASWMPGSVDLFCAFVDQTLDGHISTLDARIDDPTLLPTRWTGMTILQLYGRR